MQPGLHHYFELLSLLVALYRYKELSGSFMIWFVPYLFITLGTESLANYLYHTHQYSTVWIYNLLTLFSQVFYTCIFYRLAIYKSQEKLLVILTGFFVLLNVVFFTVLGSVRDFSYHLLAAGGIIQVVYACFYYYQYLQNDDYLKNYKWNTGLWIASGVLIFYSGITICFSLYQYIKVHHLTIGGLPLYNAIPRYLSVILYSCLSISFLTWRKTK